MALLDTLKRLLVGPEAQPLPDLGRNDRCWCGSGLKYKACHLERDARRRSAERASQNPSASGGMF